MSQAPRPKTFSSLIVATKGSVFQSLETGTTSVCPEKIIDFFLLGFFVYRWLSLSGESFLSEKGIGMFVPIISIVFLSVANKAIKKDEDLVKSVDRLR